MRLQVLILLLIILCSAALSQDISNAEYFFDSDPGFGNGTSLAITQSDTPVVDVSVSVSALSTGLHRCYLRYQDERGYWSIADTRLFYLLDFVTPDTSDNIVAGEYFFDADPGAGNGSAIAISEGPEPSVSFPVDVEALSPGLHRFYLRYQDEFERWSIADARLFYITQISIPQNSTITAAEYFFNHDPGCGNGTALSVVPSDAPAVAGEISIAGLPDGLSRFYLRYKDDRDNWSIADARLFYIVRQTGNSEVQLLAGAEFFINVDPGLGLGEPLMPVDGAWDSVDETVIDSVSGIPLGLHVLGLRYLDNRGLWSATAVDTFVVGPVLTAYPDPTLQSIVLYWKTGPEAVSFDVQRTTRSDSLFTTIATVPESTYTDIGVLTESQSMYFYQIVQNNPGRSTFRFPSERAVEQRRASKTSQ